MAPRGGCDCDDASVNGGRTSFRKSAGSKDGSVKLGDRSSEGRGLGLCDAPGREEGLSDGAILSYKEESLLRHWCA